MRRRKMARRGTTLIELLAGLVVLGVLLVAVGMARARFMRQEAEANQRLADVRAADALLGRWLDGPTPQIPLNAQGTLDGSSGRIWRTRIKSDPSATALGALIVQLQIINVAGGRGNIPAEFSVDVLVHDVRIDQPAKVATSGDQGKAAP
jgi:prepilin-type N-terminal cleavage/methylation domain-containing protein